MRKSRIIYLQYLGSIEKQSLVSDVNPRHRPEHDGDTVYALRRTVVLHSMHCTSLDTDARSENLLLFHICSSNEFFNALFSIDCLFDRELKEKPC